MCSQRARGSRSDLSTGFVGSIAFAGRWTRDAHWPLFLADMALAGMFRDYLLIAVTCARVTSICR